MTTFHVLTGADFGRANAWARKQPLNPINAAIRKQFMSQSTHQIQAAINAAEAVTPATGDAQYPVTVSQETITALIETAKRYLELSA